MEYSVTRGVAALVATCVLVAGALVPAASSATSGPDAPVLVLGADAVTAADAVAAHGGSVTRELPLVGGVAAVVPAQARDALERAPGLEVVDDAALRVLDAPQDALPGADVRRQLDAMSLPEHWDGRAGAGVGVALVDTGVADVPELEGRVVHALDLSDDDDPTDRHGHGTFMAGLIAGDGSTQHPNAPTGLAPGAHVVSLKVADADGRTSLSRVIEAIGWAVVHQDEYDIRVLNLSIGAEVPFAPQADPLGAAVQAAWASGITVVAAAGNLGDGTVTSPGRDPWVLTVGAVDAAQDPERADWSGQGRIGRAHKPDVLAPGVSVVSTAAPGSGVANDHPDSFVSDHHLRGSGTSMATALVSGAAAVLLEHRALATPDDVKGALRSTATPVPGAIGGMIDLAAADAADAEADWVQRHPVRPRVLPPGSGNRMPWAQPGTPGSEVTWQRIRWMDDAWHRIRWMDGTWQRIRWMDGTDWQRIRWMDDADWQRIRWMDVDLARIRWMDAEWQRIRWMEARTQRIRWMDVNLTRIRWMQADWQRIRWMDASFDLVGTFGGDGWGAADFASADVNSSDEARRPGRRPGRP